MNSQNETFEKERKLFLSIGTFIGTAIVKGK